MAPTPATARPCRAPGPAADSQVLLQRWHRDRDPGAHDELVERFLPLARKLAGSYPAGGEREDLMQVAALGLLNALERYDPARGTAFVSFAIPTILGELRRYFRDHGWAVRVPRHVQELAQRCQTARDELTAELGRSPTVEELAAACDTTAERVVEARATASAHFAVSLNQPRGEDEEEQVARLACEEAGLARVEASLSLCSLLEPLPPRERTIMRLRFEDELTQAEIGRLVGLSQMQVSRLIRHCIAELSPA